MDSALRMLWQATARTGTKEARQRPLVVEGIMLIKSSIAVAAIFLTTFAACEWLLGRAEIKPAKEPSEAIKPIPQPNPDGVFPKKAIAIPPGKVFDLKAAIPDGTSYAWAVPPNVQGIEFRSAGTNGFIFPQASGTYYLGMAYGNPIQFAWITVTVDGKDMPPPAPPQPVPPPPQPPKDQPPSGQLTLIVVYDKIPVLPPFSSYVPLTDLMLAKNYQWKLLDRNGKNSMGDQVLNPAALPEVFKSTNPYLIITDGAKVKSVQILPVAPEDMLKVVKAAE